MSDPKSSDSTIINALRIIARDFDSEDGVPNLALEEAANRFDELLAENKLLHARIAELEAKSAVWEKIALREASINGAVLLGKEETK